jgi:diacylglycerol kinase family enzyme
MRRAALLFNPRAGRHRGFRLEAIRAALERAGFDLDFQSTAGPEHCRALARRAVEDRLDALFVLGGDGTLRIAASALAGSPVALGALPGGTTNVVALALGLPADPVEAARRLATAEPRPFDLGRAGEDDFLMQLSGGLDARVMASVDPRLKRRLGKGAVAWAGVREWWRYRFPAFALEIDGRATEATGFVVANLAEYAGRYRIVPGARSDDRRLDLLLFHGRRRRDALGFALDLARGRHLARADVEVLPFERLRLTAPAPLVLQYDGDPFEAAPPLEVALAPERLLLLAPARP